MAGRDPGAAARGIAACALALAAAAPAAAQDGVGTTATLVLQIAPAPRPLALGDAYAAAAADELGIFYNPARLAAAAGSAGLAYQSFPADIGAGSLAGAFRLGPGVVGGGVHFVDLGEVEVFEPDPGTGGQSGRPTGERVGAGEVALSVGYGVALGRGVQLGVAGKLLHAQLADAAASGTAVDVGVAIELLGGRAVLAAAAQNLGPAFGPGRPAPLPGTWRAGGVLTLGDAGPRALLAVELIARNGRIAPAFGVEGALAARGDLALVGRAGYDGRSRGDDAQAPLVFGGGLVVGAVAVDYAFRALGPLGHAHQFGLSVHSVP